MTLVEFLLARFAEDEAVARKHIANWTDGDGDAASGLHGLRADNEYPVMDIGAGRVLAECEAKRRIMGIAADQLRLAGEAGGWDNWRDMAMQTLHALALPYADHPDFDPAWRA